MAQFSSGGLGSVNLIAGGDATQDLRNLPKGSITSLYMLLSVGIKSTSGAFNAVISTGSSAAAEGVDDLDVLLDTIINRLSFYLDPQSQVFSLKPSQLRTVLGYFNQRDYLGSLQQNSAIPANGSLPATFQITIKIPLSLKNLFPDGNIFAQGSTRLSTGSLIYSVGQSLTPQVTLANGTALVTSFSVKLSADAGGGEESDVGPSWKVQRIPSLPSNYQLPDATRLAIFHIQPAATSGVATWNVTGGELMTPGDFAARYQSDRLNLGGYDVTARVTPLYWVESARQFSDFIAHLHKGFHFDTLGSIGQVSIYDITVTEVPANVVEMVAMKTGGGGAVRTSHPAPASLPGGTGVSSALAGLLPVRVSAAPANAAGAMTPQVAGAQSLVRMTNSRRAGGFLGRMSGK